METQWIYETIPCCLMVPPRGGANPIHCLCIVMTSSVSGPVDYKDIVVLVVEDSEFLRQVVKRVLLDLGIRDVRYVRTENEGRRAFVERAAHLVIVEFGRTCHAAADLLAELRQAADANNGATGLIALVPEPNRERVIQARNAGAEAIVAEPIAPKELAEHIEAVIRRHQAHVISPAAPTVGQAAAGPASADA